MALIEAVFNHEAHSYTVPDGEEVLATSDVIALNGLSDMGQVPKNILEHASHRGTCVHRCVQAYETGLNVDDTIEEYESMFHVDLAEDVTKRMKGYYRFRDKYELTPRGEMEVPKVYRHRCDQLIGGTPDFPCYVNGVPFILDLKTSFRNTGAKAKQDLLKWKAQLQSYKEIEEAETGEIPQSAIVHLHPNCGKGLGYDFHITHDDSLLWEAMVIIARAKLMYGHKRERNTDEIS